MRENAFDADASGCAIAPVLTPCAGDGLFRAARWQPPGIDEPRLPPVFLLEFSRAAFARPAFERYAIPFPAALAQAVPKRQAEFLAGRVAAREAIGRLGIAASVPAIGPSRQPLWQAGVTGSISHTDRMAGAIAVVSSSVRGVGLDIENVVHGDAREAILKLALTPGEYALLESRRSALSVDAMITIAFSAKESFFKGVFADVGRHFDFGAARLSRVDVASGRVALTLEETLCPALPRARSFEVHFGLLSEGVVMTCFVW